MNFKQWYLNEVGTSTSSVAVFARPIFGSNLITRTWPSEKKKDEAKKKK